MTDIEYVMVEVVVEREEGFDVRSLKDVLVGRRRLGACGRQIVMFPVPPLSMESFGSLF